MEILLKRKDQTKNATFGELYINNELQCYTIEDIKRENKVYGKTRIPDGTYEIQLRNQGRVWKKYMLQDRFSCIKEVLQYGLPHLQKVPNFRYILIHCGNTAIDTKGWILPGLIKNIDIERIEQSTAAFIKIFPLIAKPIINGEKVYIKITSEVAV